MQSLRALQEVMEAMRRLYRSRSNAMLAGVCGGLGHYLGIDPTWARLFFVLLTLVSGAGVVVYVVMWIVVPQAPAGEEPTVPVVPLRDNPQAHVIVGAGLILLGGLAFLKNLHLPWLQWLRMETVWPVLLILAGAVLLLNSLRRER